MMTDMLSEEKAPEAGAETEVRPEEEYTVLPLLWSDSKSAWYVDQALIVYEPHRRGHNWVATVHRDPAAPGGLARKFWRRGSGSMTQIPTDLKTGDKLEFAGDYYTSCGNPRFRRRYFEVVAIAVQTEPQVLTLKEIEM